MRRKNSITMRELESGPSELSQKLEGIAKSQAKKAIKNLELIYGIIDPDYARIFSMARTWGWNYGYAILFHGSFTRDLDLVAVPWTAAACEPDKLVRLITQAADLNILVKSKESEKEHGRLVWTLTFKAFGDPRFIDFSVMPRLAAPVGRVNK